MVTEKTKVATEENMVEEPEDGASGPTISLAILLLSVVLLVFGQLWEGSIGGMG